MIETTNGRTRPTVTLAELPGIVRIARRGRPFHEVAAECGLAGNTIAGLEAGDSVGMRTLQKIANWIQVDVLIEARQPEVGESVAPLEGLEEEVAGEEGDDDGE
jgi:transcriptional regulator with XRE-family HTH domain